VQCELFSILAYCYKFHNYSYMLGLIGNSYACMCKRNALYLSLFSIVCMRT